MKLFVRNKAWSDLVVVLSFFSLVIEILCNVKVRKLGRLDDFSVYFECEGAKVFIVDSSSCLDVLLYILTESLNDKMELGLWIKRFSSFVGTRL